MARHHESQWNQLGRWTGIRDVSLTEYGLQKSKEMGKLLDGAKIDRAFSSGQKRAIESLSAMLSVRESRNVPVAQALALNERDYGEYTGKNKWEMEELLGEKKFKEVRRGWNCPIPGGETLKQVYERSVPYFLDTILPRVAEGESVLLVAHGNSLRVLLKYIENISDENIANVEFPFGAIVIYDLDDAGRMIKKETMKVESSVPA